MTNVNEPNHEPVRAPKPEPVRRRGEPFFDELVGHRYDPSVVRRTLHLLHVEQYAEADRIQAFRPWGGAASHGTDRYLYSLEQERRLGEFLPGSEMLRPDQSLLYGIADALIYPTRYGADADDCPTRAQQDAESNIQTQLAYGYFYEMPTLFDPDPERPRTVVWLLFTGNHIGGGPLSSYLARPGGLTEDGRIDWLQIEPLLNDNGGVDPEDDLGSRAPAPQLPPEPTLPLSLRR